MNNPFNLWTYQCDQHGMARAADLHFSSAFEQDPILHTALIQLKLAEFAINARMKELADI